MNGLENWVDDAASWKTCRTTWYENHHPFAKVRVAGSNPVFRCRDAVF